jgi:tetratricopeptide (TPR) repeat protein
LFPEYDAGPIDEYVPLGIEAADHALLINPVSARALTARAYIRFMYEYDYPAALADFQRAIELEPGYPTAHQWYGELLSVLRRTDEAIEQLDIAASLDPRSAVIAHVKGWILMGAGRYQEAQKQFELALQINPDYPNSVGNLEIIYLMMGNYDQARVFGERFAQLLGNDPKVDLAVIDAMENPALKPHALELLQASEEIRDGLEKAQLLMLLGEDGLALTSLELGFEAGDPYAVHVNRLDIYDPLRGNPRFQALLKKMNFEP